MQNLTRRAARRMAGLVAISILGPIVACGRPDNTVIAAPPEGHFGSVPGPAQQRQGMSTKQKLALLAGAAAVYYLYQKHKNKQGAGAQGQYYRSRNGRVYYRDANGKAIWVTPPPQGIMVPQQEAEMYRRGALQAGFDRVYSGAH